MAGPSLEKEGCTNCTTRLHNRIKKALQAARPNIKQTLGIVMQSALPGEIDKTFHHNLTSDSTLTLPHIQSCLEDIMQEMGISTTNLPTNPSIQAPIHLLCTAPELGHPLIDGNPAPISGSVPPKIPFRIRRDGRRRRRDNAPLHMLERY